MKIGLSLSGGGIKGAAHIGVLRALEEAGIKINCISGASAGSIVAMLYSIGIDSYGIEEIFKQYCNKEIFDYDYIGILKVPLQWMVKKHIYLSGFIKGDRLKKAFKDICISKGCVNISNTKIPLAISSVDINTTQTVMFVTYEKIFKNTKDKIYISNVPLWEAVRASIAFPTVFKPSYFMGYYFSDGGITENMPTQELKAFGADKIIAVNLGCCVKNGVDNIIEIASQSLTAMTCKLNRKNIDSNIFEIYPCIDDVDLLDFKKLNYCIKLGYDVAKQNINKIKEYLYWN
ncbi:MAG: patatin-like phospholipase family protein [Clostridiales bacterium]|jgi:NTE family protein|nr:patatin-like phospholipase family protein [Clostridiales bacterium]